ncbi:MAG: hypothetical protein HYV09_41125 [Deltaproteobacteria bacterium]|nr:hypothetical protein [Deltaproteobacteria bacterium]
MATLTRLRRIRRVRRRAGERGAAMVEGVVAIPFFLIMLAAIIFVGRLYETKMRVMRLTKESAWNYAMCNCGDRGDPISSKCNAPEGAAAGSGGKESGKPDGFDPGEVSKAGSGPGGDLATREFGSSYAQMETKITSDKFLRGFSKQVSSKTKVMCNETPHDGNIKGWGSAAFDAFRKW